MSKFIITGGKQLSGEIEVYGAKNAAMKMIAAAVLIKDKVVLNNVPDISDVQMIINILTSNGAEISRDGHTLKIDTTNLTDKNPDPHLVKKMRGSIVLIGPYLARFGKIKIPQPGGCAIGARPIDIHLDVFRQMGAQISETDYFYEFKASSLDSKTINLKKVSVTATENALMAAVVGNGKTNIKNSACEPEIVDLANFLNKAGAKIVGAGTKSILIEAVGSLSGLEHTVIPDRIEAGTFCALAVVTKSPLKISHCEPNHLTAFLENFSKIGVKFEKGKDFIKIINSDNLTATDIETDVYPGLATDLQAPMGLVLTQAEGESTIDETVFEKRLGYLSELEEMGVKAKIIDNHRAKIYGPTKLHGRHIESLDLRAGATMILAGLAAEGKTVISNAQLVDRGYEKIEERLQKLGAQIERTN